MSTKRRQRREQRLKDKAANQAVHKWRKQQREQKAKAGELVLDDDGRGALQLNRPGHLRADARTAAQLYALGIVPEDEAKACLRRMYQALAKTEKAREMASLANALSTMVRTTEQANAQRPQTLHLHQHKTETHEADARRHRVFEIAEKIGAGRISG